jgi:DNA primase
MDNQVEEVKSKTDIVAIIGERIEIKKAGRNFKANCPFHGERTASFMVSPELQIFKCFGCAEAGDAFSFLEKFEGMEFPEALKYLADRAGVKLKTFAGAQTSEKERIIEINSQAIRFYSYLLLSHEVGKRALNYLLKERGLKRSTIEEFGLGYSPENPAFIKKFLIDKKKFTQAELERAGIAGTYRGSIYDRFSGRIIFPLFDHRGNPIGFSGRVLPWDKRETGKYINSPETPAYHKSSVLYALNLTRPFIKKKGVAIIVEGELDAISSYQAGIKNIVAIKGSALTEEQVRLLSRFSPKFILALDADLAGDAASRRGIMVASNAGVEVKVAEMSGTKDPDEAARHDLDGYKKALIGSVSIWDFFIDSAVKRNDPSTGIGKSKISREITPILSEIEDKIVQAHYIGVVSQRLGIPEEAVREQIEKFVKDPQKVDEEVPEEIKVKDRRGLLEERFLALSFQSTPKILLIKENLSFVESPFNLRIIEEFKKYAGLHKTFDLAEFSKSLPPELFDGFSLMVLRESWEGEKDDDKIKKELDLVGKELKILSVKEKLVSLTGKIKILEEKGDKQELFLAQEKFNKFASLLSKINNDATSGVIFSE